LRPCARRRKEKHFRTIAVFRLKRKPVRGIGESLPKSRHHATISGMAAAAGTGPAMRLSPEDDPMPRITSLLFDRDGTLITDKHYLADPAGVELLPEAGEALSILFRRGFRLFVVSNQSGIGRGLFSPEDVEACNAALAGKLANFGVTLADVVFCPHAPEEYCPCRKPATGLWDILQERHGLRPEAAVMVGDKAEDMAFAARARLAGRILTLTGEGMNTLSRLGLDKERAGALALRRLIPKTEEEPDVVLPHLSWLPEAIQLVENSPPGGPVQSGSRRG
jgi:D-glycero-D-manno-heptose 1,7-bisphosphate phosphatase